MKQHLLFGFGVALIVVGSLSAVRPAAAQVVVVGPNDPNEGTLFPFGSGGEYSGEYEQVYDASLFTGPTVISSIGFASQSDGFTESPTYDITVSFAQTDASSSAPSTTFSDNYGLGLTQVFNSTITPNLMANDTFDFVIPTSVFTYVPGLASDPNLLLDVVVTDDDANSIPDFFDQTTAATTAVFYDTGDPSGTPIAGEGLYTEFNAPAPAATPEPSSVAGLGFGILALAGLAFTARKRSAALRNG